jgi:hypothetical protein
LLEEAIKYIPEVDLDMNPRKLHRTRCLEDNCYEEEK